MQPARQRRARRSRAAFDDIFPFIARSAAFALRQLFHSAI